MTNIHTETFEDEALEQLNNLPHIIINLVNRFDTKIDDLLVEIAGLREEKNKLTDELYEAEQAMEEKDKEIEDLNSKITELQELLDNI